MTAPPKVTASATGLTATIALVILDALQTWVFHAPVPADVATLVATVVAPLLIAAAGYLAHKHAVQPVVVASAPVNTAANTVTIVRTPRPWPPTVDRLPDLPPAERKPGAAPPSVDELLPPPVPARGGYTGRRPARDVPPPPADVPSLTPPVLPAPAPPEAKP